MTARSACVAHMLLLLPLLLLPLLLHAPRILYCAYAVLSTVCIASQPVTLIRAARPHSRSHHFPASCSALDSSCCLVAPPLPPVAVAVLPASSHAAAGTCPPLRRPCPADPAYLCVNELMQAAALSRSIRTAFDSDAVWYRRFMDVCSIMRLYVEMPVPAAAVLSAAQLAALPPLPSLAEAAALCEQAYRESELCKETPSHLQPPCVAAIVHLPCTLLYHARIVGRCIADQHVLKQFAEHIEFTLTYSQQLLRWTVQEVGESGSGRRALCVDNNVDACRARSDSVDRPPAAPTIGSYKQRYIHILTCRSDRQCYHLVQPTRPTHYRVNFKICTSHGPSDYRCCRTAEAWAARYQRR